MSLPAELTVLWLKVVLVTGAATDCRLGAVLISEAEKKWTNVLNYICFGPPHGPAETTRMSLGGVIEV